jgi:hypothetical protein
MDDIPICPDWWPQTLWQLHHPVHVHWPGSGPVNMPAEVNQILINLQLHTSSYHMNDKGSAKEVRKAALTGLQAAVEALAGAD